MTAIIGIRDHERKVVLIASDSMATDGGEIYTTNSVKIKRLGSLVVGAAGWTRLTQKLFADKFSDEAVSKAGGIWNFLVGPFTAKIMKLQDELKAETAGCASVMLVAWRDRLFEVYNDHTIQELDNYWAVGSGQDLALGSLYTTFELEGLSIEDKAQLALESAEAYKATVRGPFNFVWSG